MIYLDNAATTKVDSKVVAKMLPYFEKEFGNASSLHEKGLKAKEALENSRKIIANSINAQSKEIFFTSGGTEANNLAIKGLAFASRDTNKEKNHIITTKVEHKCIIDSCKWLETQGFEVTYLDVDEDGFVDLKQLENSITKNTILVSVIHGNNEIGTINDIEAIGKICKKHNVLFHSDACQSFTKTEIDVVKQHVNLLTINAHKIHGPKGVGALYIKNGIKITPLQHGGGQERNIRSGTENIPGIVGFAEAVKLSDKKNISKMEKLRDELIDGLLKIKGTKLNGSRTKRLCNNVNISFKGIEGEAIGGDLNDNGIASSTGSACAERNLDVSYVLTAIGCTHEEGNGSLRLSLSKYTTEKEIQTTLKIMPKIVERLRKISPYGKV